MIVLDASAGAELLLGTPAAPEIAAALSASRPVIAPVHFDTEVYGALRRLHLQGRLDRRRFELAVDRLEHFDAERLEIVSLLSSAVRLIDVFGAHDVFYVLLAMSRDCRLLTCDLSLGRAAAALGVSVTAIDRSRPV